MNISGIDLVIIAIYLAAMVLIRCLVGFRKNASKGKGNFLTSGTLTWPIIGLALFSINISTIHLAIFENLLHLVKEKIPYAACCMPDTTLGASLPVREKRTNNE